MRSEICRRTLAGKLIAAAMLAASLGWVGLKAPAADWPMWRYDAGRTAASPLELPAELHLLWKRELPAPGPAFPHDNRLRFDLSYEPVVMGKSMFVPSMVTDRVTALDTETGEVRWRFFAEGPVRLAPVAWQGKVYFVSDDGYLYCLDAASGKLRWKFTPVPERSRGQKVLGHGRVVSRWPARGGPVLADGVIYFAAGLLPFEGSWVCAVDAESGKAIWLNGDSGLIREANQDHGGAWDTGLAPQGYLAIVGDQLAVPSGRALPAFFDRRTGQRQPYSAGWGGRTGLAKGSWYVAGIGRYFFQSGDLYGPKPELPEPRLPADGYITLAELARQTGSTLDTVQRWMRDLGMAVVERDGQQCVRLRNWGASHLYWTGAGPRRDRERRVQRLWPRLQIDPTNDRRSLGPFRQPVLTPEAIYYSRTRDAWLKKKDKPVHEIVAYDLAQPLRWQFAFIQGTDVPPRDLVPWKTVAFKQLWSLPCALKVHIKAGSTLYCAAKGRVAAVEIPRSGKPARVRWQASVDGTPTRLLAADGKLFVVTEEGTLWAFGGRKGNPLSYPLPKHRAHMPAEPPAESVRRLVGRTGATAGYCVVLGLGDGKLVQGLLSATGLDIIALEPDAQPAERWRRTFQSMGLYGTRVHILHGDLGTLALPPYLATLVVCQEVSGSGPQRDARYVDKLYAVLRPYGGVACLPSRFREVLAAWLRDSKPRGAVLETADQFVLLKRAGPLAGADDWTHEAGGPGNTFASGDRRVKPPLRVLWFGGAFDRLGPGCRGVPRVGAGRMFIHFGGDLLAIDIYTGRLLWRAAGISSPGLVAVEDGVYVQSGGACRRLDPATGAPQGRMEVPDKQKRAWNAFRILGDYFVGTADGELFCLDRKSGRMLWKHAPQRDRLSFALGAGKAFCIDYYSAARRRRGEPQGEQATIYALDVAAGMLQWRTGVVLPADGKRERPPGPPQPMAPGLAYCPDSDLIVLTANGSILGAWQGKDGKRLWAKAIPCDQPPILLPNLLVTRSGQTVDPKTGRMLPNRLWQGIRGCNRALGCPQIVVLRDADISYFDLAHGGRQTRLRGIRSGCTNGLLPAGGVLSAPNLAYHCSCNYPVFTSMALVHMPQASSRPAATEIRKQ